jgi:hypothetical protein
VSGPLDFEMLAAYDAERERGIVHTPEWDARMAALRLEFDAHVEAVLERARQPDGRIILPAMTPAVVWDAVRRIERRRKEPTP